MHGRKIALALAFFSFAVFGQTSSMLAQTRVEFENWRHNLVDKILVPAGITDPRVVKAMRDTPRHEFVPIESRSKSYYDMGLPIGNKQTISSPLMAAPVTR